MTQLYCVSAEVGPVGVRISRHDNNADQMQVNLSACIEKQGVYVQPSFTFYALSPESLREVARAFLYAAVELESAQESVVL